MQDLKFNGVFLKLSKREFEVARFIFNGKRTTEIASKLKIKSNTVSTIKKNIFFKLGIKSEADLIKLSIYENLA